MQLFVRLYTVKCIITIYIGLLFVMSQLRKCENMNDKRSTNDNIYEKLTFWLENVFGVVERCLLDI